MIVSDQQPYLFPYAGIVAKQAVSDVHVVLADIRYRPEDKLAIFRLPDGGSFQPQMIVDESDDCLIRSVTLGGTAKFKRALEQTLLTRKCRMRDRFAEVIDTIYEGMPYMQLWADMTDVHLSAVQKKQPLLVISEVPPEGENTFERNLDRLEREVDTEMMTSYLCGPNVRSYHDPKHDRYDHVMVVMEARDPSPMSVAYSVARHEEVCLGDYSYSKLKA